MSVAVKPHQAFFRAARTAHAAGFVPLPRRVLALRLRSHRRAGPGGGGTSPSRSAGVRLGPGARPEQPSIRVEPAMVPSTSYRVRLERPARLKQGPTHRTNGAFAGSPSGTTAALADLACSTLTAAATTPPFSPVLVPPSTRTRALHGHGRHLGAPPRRRTHAQPPVLLRGPFRHLPLVHVPPQGDQQLAS